MTTKFRRLSCTALAIALLYGGSGSLASAASSSASPAPHSVRSALVSIFARNDGNASEVSGVYVARWDSALAVVCARTPEAGLRAYVFHRVSSSWRYLTSGAVGRAGSSADRALERACG